MTHEAALYRSLASMHRAGISWPRAIESAAGADPRFVPVRRALEDGRTLAEALQPVVDALDVALLQAGERDGSLERTLEVMAASHEEEERRRKERTVREWYPRVLGHIAAGLMALPDLLQGRPLAALGWALAVLVPLWAWIFLQRRLERRERPDTTGAPPLPPPAVGPLRNRVDEADARGLEALGRLYEAGVPLEQAVDLALRAGWGGRVALDLAALGARVERGEDLAGAFTRLPPDLARRIATAEESGSVGQVLVQIAEELRYGSSVRRRKTAQIVPVLMILGLALLIFLRLATFYAGFYGRLRGL